MWDTLIPKGGTNLKILKLVAVEQVQVGDTLIVGATRFMVTAIDEDAHGRDFSLKNFDGVPSLKFIGHGEKVTIEL